jgi:hypothetical protein
MQELEIFEGDRFMIHVLRPAQEFFTYTDFTITGEGLQNLGLCLVLIHTFG